MSKQSQHDRRGTPTDPRRILVLLLAIGLLAGSFAFRWYSNDSSNTFAAAAMARVGLVLGALWLAWDSLRRPARWLPPGIAALGVLALIAIASQPRLALVVIPALGTLIALGTFIRVFKR